MMILEMSTSYPTPLLHAIYQYFTEDKIILITINAMYLQQNLVIVERAADHRNTFDRRPHTIIHTTLCIYTFSKFLNVNQTKIIYLGCIKIILQHYWLNEHVFYLMFLFNLNTFL